MNSQSSQSNESYRTTFGIYNPLALGITLENLSSYAAEAEKETTRLQQLALQSPTRYHEELRKHHDKFQFYYRVRAHEKAHWYTAISSSVMIARLFADGDTSNGVRHALEQLISDSDMPIYLPLGRWAQQDTCPKYLKNAVLVYNINKYINAAIDGILLPQHMLSTDLHMLTAYFSDLESLGSYWQTPSYSVGLLSLVEGAGKAAEWYYYVRDDNTQEERALQDILSSPKIYSEAFKQLASAVPGKSFLDYLQILVVLIDIALNPYVHDESWPFLWGNAKGVDALPGFRFKRLLEIAKEYPRFDAKSKESIASFFESVSYDKYGWEPASEVVSQIRKLLEQSPVFSRDDSLWNPLETIHKVMMTKTLDHLTYVPPVNADLINRHETYPRIMLTAGIDRAPDINVLYTFLSRDLDAVFLDNIVNIGTLQCPVSNNNWFLILAREKGLCSKKENECVSRDAKNSDWDALMNCTVYDAMLKRFFKEEFQRIQFI